MYTRMSFGDNTSPSNFEIVAVARMQLAQYLWNLGDSIIERVSHKLPTLNFPMMTENTVNFEPAVKDRINKGVINPNGKRQPPPFRHHVDDNLYADVPQYFHRAVAASLLSIYTILGWPDGRQPDPFSFDKLETEYSHIRKCTGVIVNSRELTIALPEYKRNNIIELIEGFLSSDHYNIVQAAQLCGTLESASTMNRTGRLWFTILQGRLRNAIRVRYKIVTRLHQHNIIKNGKS